MRILGGGLPEFSFNVIAGPPGSGKTTLAHQIMFALAKRKRPALYFTVLGEPPLKMLRYQQQFEFFDSEQVNGAIRFINLADDTASGDLDRCWAGSSARSRRMHRRRCSSIRSLGDAGQPGWRQVVHGGAAVHPAVGMMMTSWQTTTFLIGEYMTEFDPDPVFTVADGLIWLRQSLRSNSVVRKMEIIKMRGRQTLPGLHTFRISAAGIQVFAPAPVATSFASPAALRPGARLRMGYPNSTG